MRKFNIRRGFIIIAVTLLFMCTLRMNVYAAANMDETETTGEEGESNESGTEDASMNIQTVESDELLGVTVVNLQNENVMVRANSTLYTNDALLFRPAEKSYPEAELIERSEFYSFSYDCGETYSELNDMDKGGLRLDAIDDDTDYYIQFTRADIVRKVTHIERIGTDEHGRKDADDNDTEMATSENETAETVTTKKETDIPESDYEEVVYYYKYVYKSNPYHVVFDKTSPELTEQSSVNWGEWSAYKRMAVFSAEDTRSGLTRIVVKDSTGEVLYEKHDFSQEGTDGCRQKFEISLDKQSKDENGVGIFISVCDGAGNYYEREYCYYNDFEAPLIFASGATDKEIVNRDISLLFTATDNINSLLRIEYEIQYLYKGNTGISEMGKVLPVNSAVSFEKTLTESGSYTVKARAVDAAGNASEQILINFRIDKNTPVLSIEGFENGADYNSSVMARMIINEDYYEDAAVYIKAVRRMNGKDNVVFDGEVHPDGYRYVKELNLYEEGDYQIIANAVDAAGNDVQTEGHLRIDKTSPIIEITGTVMNSISKDVPQFIINVSETFYDSMKERIYLYRKNDYGIYETVNEIIPATYSETTSLPMSVYEEGDYMLKVLAEDRAGNYSEKNIEFSYDCSAPQIGWIDSIRRRYIKNFRLPKGFISNIWDKNRVSYNAYLNTIDINEETVISKDGKYVLRIIAIDEAGNISDETAEFIIDNTAPKIVVSGLMKDGIISKGSSVCFSLYDSEDYFEQVTFDNELIDMTNDNKKCEFRIDKEGKHKIQIKAVDYAGNETDRTFMVACSGNIIKGRKTEEVSKADTAFSEIHENQSVKVNKKTDKKYLYLFSAFVLGISSVGVLILLHLRRVDTNN